MESKAQLTLKEVNLKDLYELLMGMKSSQDEMKKSKILAKKLSKLESLHWKKSWITNLVAFMSILRKKLWK